MNLNKIMIAGRLTRDPNYRVSPSGTEVCNLGLAINDAYKEKETVTYVECTAFGKTATNANKYLTKGSRIFIEGRLKLDQWEDKQTGQKRSKLNVIVEKLTFVDTRDESQSQTEHKPSQETQNDTDVPF